MICSDCVHVGNFYHCLLCVLSLGMKHREERVIGGEVKPTALTFEEEDDEDPQVLYDKVCSFNYMLLLHNGL